MVNMTFTSQSNPEIKKKLQKLEKALGMPISQLVEIAFKVSNSGYQVQERNEQRRMKQQAILLVAALTQGLPCSPPRGRS